MRLQLQALFSRWIERTLQQSRGVPRKGRRFAIRSEDLETRVVLSAVTPEAAVTSAVSTHIINGTQTNEYPSVGMVGDAQGAYGSGTLIGSRFVLTAGHCAEGVSATGGRFFLGGQTYSTVRVHLHPQYNANLIGSDQANDIAIFELDRDVIGVTPSPIFRSSPAVGSLLTLVGFGGGGTGTTGTNGDFGVKRVGTTSIDQVTSTLIHWNFENNTESNTAPGDSGGPAYLSVNGQLYVAGVTSGGDKANASIGDHSFDTRVDPYATWIDSIVGNVTQPPPPAVDDHSDVVGSTATAIALNAQGAGSSSGVLEEVGDRDVFRFVVTTAGNVTVNQTGANGLDTYLRLLDTNGNVLAQNDDSNGTLNSLLTARLATGTYYVSAGAYADQATGSYQVAVAFTADPPPVTVQDYFFSVVSAATLTNSNATTLAVDDSDIVKLSVSSTGSYTYSLYFDGSDVGLTTDAENLDAFSILPDGRILVSTSGAVSVTGVTGTANDVLVFRPTSIGATTAGTWAVHLRGSQYGLNATAGNIDGVDLLADGTTVISISGSMRIGTNTYSGEDLIKLLPNRLLDYYVDGSDVGLTTTTERIDAFDIDSTGTIHISTNGAFSVTGVSGAQADVFAFRPTQLGTNTTGSFATTLDLRAASFRLSGVNLDGFQLGGVSSNPSTPTPPPPTTGGYQVTVRFTDSTLTTTQRAVFQQAADRWAQIIIGDVPDLVVGGISVDDIVIDASAPTIDGRGGILGQAGPTSLRTGSMLPSRGVMQFDAADLAALEASGDLLPVILHEMGHVIGIGTIWQNLSLVQTVGTEIRFTGANAVAEYNSIFGTTGNFVPVETDGGPGTAGGHWDEAVFNNELMTGYLNGGTQNPISRVTVGALRDMGYQVNLSAADSYSRTSTRKANYYVWGDHEHSHDRDSAHSRAADHHADEPTSTNLMASAKIEVEVRANRLEIVTQELIAVSPNRFTASTPSSRETVQTTPSLLQRNATSPASSTDIAAIDLALTDLHNLFDRI